MTVLLNHRQQQFIKSLVLLLNHLDELFLFHEDLVLNVVDKVLAPDLLIFYRLLCVCLH